MEFRDTKEAYNRPESPIPDAVLPKNYSDVIIAITRIGYALGYAHGELEQHNADSDYDHDDYCACKTCTAIDLIDGAVTSLNNITEIISKS